MKFEDIQNELKTQDNRITSDPIFIVYDWRKLPTTVDYCDDWEYADIYDGYIAIGKTKEDLIDWAKDNGIYECFENMSAEDIFDKFKTEGYEVMKNYYFKKRTFINVFFTEKSAKEFIESNNYHFSKEVHIYVASLWRNPEMQKIRNALIEGRFQKEENKENGKKES